MDDANQGVLTPVLKGCARSEHFDRTQVKVKSYYKVGIKIERIFLSVRVFFVSVFWVKRVAIYVNGPINMREIKDVYRDFDTSDILVHTAG